MNYQIETFLPLLQKALDRFAIPARPASLYDPIRYFLSLPAKRIRPVFVLQSLELYRQPTETDAVAALSTELFHNFSLVHDDMMDQADLRRGFETVHKKWDEPTALLAGDALLILAYQALMESRTDDLKSLIIRFNEMSLAVCEGQQLDMDFSRLELIEPAQYFEMIDRKTGALIAFSFEMGGFLGHAPEEERKALHDFGLAMGRCFQLRDDYLDSFGDEQKTGKKRGGDVGNCKLSYPVLLALTGENRQIFEKIWYRKPAADPGRIEAVLNWMEENQTGQKVEAHIKAEMEKGMELLHHISGNADTKKRIETLCSGLAYRER